MRFAGTGGGARRAGHVAVPGLATLVDEVQTSGWTRRLQPERPMRSVRVVVLDVVMKHSTYSRRSPTVSTVKKSQPTIPEACWRRKPARLYHVLVQRWSAGLGSAGGPGAGHQASVPAQQRLRPDEETGPAGSGHPRLMAASQGSVGGPESGSSRLAAQHTELVAQDEDLQILGGVVIGEQGEELDGAAQRQVGESRQHLGAASATG
jgi:hypothetical protein